MVSKAVEREAEREKAFEMLDAYEQSGEGLAFYRFVRYGGYTSAEVNRWISKYPWSPEFKKRLTALKARNTRIGLVPPPRRSKNDEGTIGNSPLLDKLSAPKRRWLFLFKEKGDRTEACAEVGVRWVEVRAWIKVDKTFRAAYNEIWDEKMVAIEDGYIRQALDGDKTASAKILTAHVAGYSTSSAKASPKKEAAASEGGAAAETDWLDELTERANGPIADAGSG